MSRSLAAIGIIAAISIGGFIARISTDARVNSANVALAQTGGDSTDTDDRADNPAKRREQSNPVRGDVPLTHAILRDEKDDSAESRILDALGKPTTVEFLDLPLEDALTFLKEYHQISLWIDKSHMADEGIPLDQPVTLKLAGLRLESILNLLLPQSQLDWVIADEVLKITTRSWADANPEVRAYDVQNLVDAGHTPEELVVSVTRCVAPASWTAKELTNGISHSGGVLIVRQSQRNHAEIAHLLEDLDAIADADEDQGPARTAVVSVKVYPTGDQPPEKLAECLQDFVETKSWQNRGGSGKVRPLAGALVVEQTASVHQSIQRFLSRLSPQSPAVTATAESAGAKPRTDPFGVLNPPGHPDQGASRP